MNFKAVKISAEKKKRAALIITLIGSSILLALGINRFNTDNNYLDKVLTQHYNVDQEHDDLQILLLNIQKIESGERGFIATGDKRFIQNIDSDLINVDRLFYKIQGLKNSLVDKNDKISFFFMDSLISEKIIFVQRVIALCDNNKRNEAISLIASGEGKRLTDAITEIQYKKNKAISEELERSKYLYRETNNRNNRFGVLFMVASLLLFLLIFYFLIIEIRKKERVSHELVLQKEHFRLALHNIGKGLIRTDGEGRIVYMNPLAEQLTGWKSNYARTKPFEKFFNIDISGPEADNKIIMHRIISEGATFEMEDHIVLHPRSSAPIIIHLSGSPIFETDGKISGALLVFSDITERKINEDKIKESEIFISGVLDSLRSHIAVLNSNGIILKVNKSWISAPLNNGEINLEGCGEGENYFEACMKGINSSHPMAADTITGIREVLKGTISEFYLEYPSKLNSGEKWFYMKVKKFEGSETMAVIEHHDITIRKNAETELKKAHDNIQLLLDSIAEGAYGVDNNGICTFVNKSFLRLLGYNNANELIGKEIHLLMHHSHANGTNYPASECKMLNSRKTKQHVNVSDEVFWRKDGVPIPVEYWSYPIMQNGNILGAICTFIDITERKKWEIQLRKSEEKFRYIFNNSTIGKVLTALDGKFLQANQALANMLGYSILELQKLNFREITHPDDIAISNEGIRSLLANERSTHKMEKRYFHKNGSIVWTNVSFSLLRDHNNIPQYFITSILDITEQKKAEEEIKKSEEKYRTIFLKSPLPMWIYDFETLQFLDVNEAAILQYGYTREEFLHMTIKDIRRKEDLEPLLNDLIIIQKFGGSQQHIWRHLKKNGELMTVETTAHSFDYNNRKARLVTANDITEREKAEKEILDYKFALDESSLVDVSDSNGIIQYVNDNFCKVSKYSSEELIGRDHRIFNSGYHSKDVFRDLWNTVTAGKVWKKEVRNKAKDGSFFWTDTTIVPFLGTDDRPYQFIVVRTDITARKQAQDEIIQKGEELRMLSDHLQKIREEERTNMAREIHDELGQQLTVMKMDVSWLHNKLSKAEEPVKKRTDELKDILDETVTTVRRIASELRPSILDDMGLGAAIEWHLKEFEKKSGMKTEFENIEKEPQLPEIVKSNLFRIVQESLTNVNRYAKAKKVIVSLRQNSGQLFLTVKDDGIGFDIEKAIAKQTFGILGMKERSFMMGGTFEISSISGKGTTVKVQVPYKNLSN